MTGKYETAFVVLSARRLGEDLCRNRNRSPS